MATRAAAVFLSISLCLLPSLAASQARQCVYRDAIVGLADDLLDDLHAADPTIARAYGRDAAFVKMYYGTMNPVDIDALLGRLEGNSVAGAAAFSLAYYVTVLGFDKAKLKMADGVGPALKGSVDLTLMRALAKAGRYDLAAERMSAFSLQPQKAYLLPLALPFIDNPPAERKRMADIAEQQGAVVLAGELYASLPTRDAWTDFLKRHYRELGFLNLWGHFQAYSAVNFDKEPLTTPLNRSDGAMSRRFVQRVSAATWLVPGPSILYEYMHQFPFEPVYGSRAALALKSDFDKQTLKPSGPIEQGWLLSYRALAAASAADDPHLMQKRMRQVTIRSHHYLQGTVGAILDTMLAGETIGAWLRKPEGDFPAPPDLASDALKADWNTWRALAMAIRDGREPEGLDANPARRGMAADLLYWKGDAVRLLALISAEKDDRRRQRLEVDFLSRLDRRCDASLYFPGDGLFLRDSTIYRFDTIGYAL